MKELNFEDKRKKIDWKSMGRDMRYHFKLVLEMLWFS